MSVANPLDYYNTATITAIKSFIVEFLKAVSRITFGRNNIMMLIRTVHIPCPFNVLSIVLLKVMAPLIELVLSGVR
jgi:hypothetical protein